MVAGMTVPQAFDPFDSIASDSAGLADAATGNLAAPVAHCPGWSVADLVRHLLGVHQAWGQVVERRLSEPSGITAVPPPADADLLAAFRTGAVRLVEILRAADPTTAVWTWAKQHDVAFVIRHQVQEAAVHRWDAEQAAGRPFVIGTAAAADAVEEFFEHSLGALPEGAEQLVEPVRVQADDAGLTWTLVPVDGLLTWSRGSQPAGTAVRGTASDLLLWLYGRRGTDELAVTGALGTAQRVRNYATTD